MRISTLFTLVPFLATAIAIPITTDSGHEHGHNVIDVSPDHVSTDNLLQPDIPVEIPEHIAKDPAVVMIYERQNLFMPDDDGAPPPPTPCAPGRAGGAGCG
ncbi:hypothetical protein RBB50_005735 [Rhinocladiella similis]